MIDRFRSLPMARSAFLAGPTLADLSRSVLALAFMIGFGLLVGFRFHNGAGPVYHDLWQAVLWCIGIFVVFLAVSLSLYRKASA